jgi:hypothetical protein
MIHYEEIEPYLIDFLQGNVAEEVEYRIKAYLQQNPDFQQELDELEETLEFTQHTPLVQPAPALKMNFYAMLNQHTAQQAVRPSVRERLRSFIYTQFHWQTLSMGILSVLILIVGYWGVAVFQERYKQTQMAMKDLEYEKNQREKQEPTLAKEESKEAPKTKQEEAAVEGRSESETMEKSIAIQKEDRTDMMKQYPTKSKNMVGEAELPPMADLEKPTARDIYAFKNSEQNGTVEISNPNGNISLKGYTGTEIKVETAPTESFVGKVEDNKISIQATDTPKIDMQVFLPQNRDLQLVVMAKQNIMFDMSGVQVSDNSVLTSQKGDIEVRTPENLTANIIASAVEVENDFEAKLDEVVVTSYGKNAQSNMGLEHDKNIQNNIALEDAETVTIQEKKDEKAKRKAIKLEKTSENRARNRTEDAPFLEKKKEESANNMGVTAKDIAPSSPSKPYQNVIIPAKNGKNNLRINSLNGKAKIKKIR